MKILLFTCRNIFSSTGEYSLIYRRIIGIKQLYGFKTDIIAFQTKDRTENYKQDLFDDEYIDKKIFLGYSLKNLFGDIYRIKKHLEDYLENERPKCIILSGYLVGLYSGIIKKYTLKEECKIIYDMHGCIEESIEYIHPRLKLNTSSKLYYFFTKYVEKKMLSISDGMFIVSNEMKKYAKDKYGSLLKNINFYYIPCGTNNKFKNESQERLRFRKAWRDNFSFKEDEIIFVYSGGISKWQKIDDIILLYESMSKDIKNTKMCIFTNEVDYAKLLIDKMAIDKSRYIVERIQSSEVTEALTACDFGILLRDNNCTNRVAFPNKFSEYIESGLNVIMSNSLIGPIEILKKHKLGVICDKTKKIDLNILSEQIKYRKSHLNDYYERCNNVIEEELDYKNLVLKSNLFEGCE